MCMKKHTRSSVNKRRCAERKKVQGLVLGNGLRTFTCAKHHTPTMKPSDLHVQTFCPRIMWHAVGFTQIIMLYNYERCTDECLAGLIRYTNNETCRRLVDSRKDRLGQAKALLTFKVKEKVWPLIKLCASEHF